MNRLVGCTIVSLAALGLSACASTQSSARYATPAAQPQQARQAAPSLFTPDAAYMTSVERVARMRGIDVRWVNPPVKRPAEGGELE